MKGIKIIVVTGLASALYSVPVYIFASPFLHGSNFEWTKGLTKLEITYVIFFVIWLIYCVQSFYQER